MARRVGAFALLTALTAASAFKQPAWLSPIGQLLARTSDAHECRCFPGDSCWPATDEWNQLNTTVGGRLIATKPIGKVCHDSEFGYYDKEACDSLKANWGFPETHYETSSSVMAPFFANQSCDPFLKDGQCVIGSYVQYAVAASSACDVKKTVAFAKSHNIRLVVRNTGHDYYGKSTGAGALAVWTHRLKGIELLDYESALYTGKAMKVGAGVQVMEANEVAKKNNLLVVGGNCPSVGLAGGYTQGGGHGQLTTKFGLSADQVLEWEVITAEGEHLLVSPTSHVDLYWALSGGGGGTYAVVLSMTIKAHPELPTASGNLTFSSKGVSQDVYYDTVKTFISQLPLILDEGGASIWLLSPEGFMVTPTTLPGSTKKKLDEIMKPVLDKLTANKMPFAYHSLDFPSYYEAYSHMNPPANITEFQLGGRLMPSSLIRNKENIDGFLSALRYIGEKGAVVSGVTVEPSKIPSGPGNSVNPAWREAAVSIVLGTPFVYTDWELMLKNQRLMTEVLLPPLEKLSTQSGVYLNEADFNQPNWKKEFYGSHYQRLLDIKKRYDPDDAFYVLTGVGSDVWTKQEDGRLCRA
ncbi:hypothetical protein FQN57_003594 [Myotisia sp. PD_48]|nr:hypothetical protein FQN57_003594 [Myotisia sp. PD_48]